MAAQICELFIESFQECNLLLLQANIQLVSLRLENYKKIIQKARSFPYPTIFNFNTDKQKSKPVCLGCYSRKKRKSKSQIIHQSLTSFTKDFLFFYIITVQEIVHTNYAVSSNGKQNSPHSIWSLQKIFFGLLFYKFTIPLEWILSQII